MTINYPIYTLKKTGPGGPGEDSNSGCMSCHDITLVYVCSNK